MMSTAGINTMITLSLLFYTTHVFSSRTDFNGIIKSIEAPWGSWSSWIYCPDYTYAIGFQIKNEASQGLGDDTSANAIQIKCGIQQPETIGANNDGQWGSWSSMLQCSWPYAIKGFKIRMEHGQSIFGDDTALNGVSMMCDDNSEIIFAGNWGSWSSFTTCGKDSFICGFRQKVESSQGVGDDTALNAIELACCLDWDLVAVYWTNVQGDLYKYQSSYRYRSTNDNSITSNRFTLYEPKKVIITNCNSEFDTTMKLFSSASDITSTDNYGCDSDDCLTSEFPSCHARRETLVYSVLTDGHYYIHTAPYSSGTGMQNVGYYVGDAEFRLQGSTSLNGVSYRYDIITFTRSANTPLMTKYTFSTFNIQGSEPRKLIVTNCLSSFDTKIKLIDETGSDITSSDDYVCDGDDCPTNEFPQCNGHRETLVYSSRYGSKYTLTVWPYSSTDVGTQTVQIYVATVSSAKSIANPLIDHYHIFGDKEVQIKYSGFEKYGAYLIAVLLMVNFVCVAVFCFKKCTRHKKLELITMDNQCV